MPNEAFKKRKNLVRQVRIKKQAAKSSTRSTSKHVLSRLHEKLETGEVGPIRPGRICKGNTMILPTKMSKKKLKKIVQQAKLAAKRNGDADDAMATDDMEEEEEEKKAVVSQEKQVERPPAKPSGMGTTLGAPGVKV
ncbi:hypothetical protein HDU97_008743 [Phlyctochytrium planicorne]|nr:hypothetical protein HDU97_008743 [Phlyctochytrium planicorne]